MNCMIKSGRLLRMFIDRDRDCSHFVYCRILGYSEEGDYSLDLVSGDE